MKKVILDYICENDNLRLTDELRYHISKRYYRNLKANNATYLVNGNIYPTYLNVYKGDNIRVEIEIEENQIDWPLVENTCRIKYEDENYLVIDKPGGLLSIPTKSEPNSVYQQIAYYLNQKNEPMTISLLNRLDKETSGLMVIAKNRLAAYNLQPTHEHMIRKYLCLCEGIFDKKEGKIVNYIAKDENSNKRYITNEEDGKIAISNYKVIKEFDNKSLVEFVLDTGRTHQIRLHTSNLGHPIIGDKMYGNGKDNDKLYLFSYYVEYYDDFKDSKTIISIKEDWEFEGVK
jgi:23S rRNA pseudouridine1911/1915/1917 synthase